MKVCSAIIRQPDGSTEQRNYESFAGMKGDARQAVEHGACVLYWWCSMSELREGERDV